jgi:hypothetical protein
MNFFSTIMAFVVLTTSPVLATALAAENQGTPPAAPPAAQPPSTPPSTTPPGPEPSTLPPAPGERSRTAPADLGQRQTVEGVVQSVKGPTMKLKSNTGRIVVVDLSKLSGRVYEITTRGETVTVIGVVEPGSERLTAQAVIGDLKTNRDAPAALPRDVQKPDAGAR